MLGIINIVLKLIGNNMNEETKALETSMPVTKKVTLSAMEYLQFTLIAKQYKEYYDIIVHMISMISYMILAMIRSMIS